MKKLIPSLVIGLLIGCASSPDKEQRCASYRQIYEMYQASLLVREPSEDERRIAAAAAVFLTAYCGWTAAATDRGISTDPYGVPIIVP